MLQASLEEEAKQALDVAEQATSVLQQEKDGLTDALKMADFRHLAAIQSLEQENKQLRALLEEKDMFHAAMRREQEEGILEREKLIAALAEQTAASAKRIEGLELELQEVQTATKSAAQVGASCGILSVVWSLRCWPFEIP